MHIRDIGEMIQKQSSFSQSIKFLRDIPGRASCDYQCEEWGRVGHQDDPGQGLQGVCLSLQL